MTTKTLKRRVTAALCGSILASLGCNAWSDGHLPAPPPILETWACTYKDGKDMDDLMSARDYMLKQADKAGLTPPAAYVWSLFKGGVPVDYVWFNIYPNLEAWTRGVMEGGAAEEMDDVGERFDATSNCQTNIATMNVVHSKESDGDGNDVEMVNSFACRLKHGVDATDVADLRRHMAGVFGSMDSAPNFTATATPMTGGPQTPDIHLFSVYDNPADWSTFVGELVASAEGQMLIRHFGTTLDCDRTLWGARQVVEGPDDDG